MELTALCFHFGLQTWAHLFATAAGTSLASHAKMRAQHLLCVLCVLIENLEGSIAVKLSWCAWVLQALISNECRLAKQFQSQCATCLCVLCCWARVFVFCFCLHSVFKMMLCFALQATYYDSKPVGSHSCLNFNKI